MIIHKHKLHQLFYYNIYRMVQYLPSGTVFSSSPIHSLVAYSISREFSWRKSLIFVITGNSIEANTCTRLCGLPSLTRTIISCTDVNINNSSLSSSHTITCTEEGTISKCCHITTDPPVVIDAIMSWLIISLWIIIVDVLTRWSSIVHPSMKINDR